MCSICFLAAYSRHLSIKKIRPLVYVMETHCVFCEYLLSILISFSHQRDGQYTYIIALRRVRVTIVAVEKQWILYIPCVCVCVCVCVTLVIQRANPMPVLCCHLWPIQLYRIFRLHRIKGTILEKEKKIENSVFRFCPQLLSENFCHPKKNSATYRSLNAIVA